LGFASACDRSRLGFEKLPDDRLHPDWQRGKSPSQIISDRFAVTRIGEDRAQALQNVRVVRVQEVPEPVRQEARRAHEMLGQGGVLGKIVLLPNG
jgi:hypothetical protein